MPSLPYLATEASWASKGAIVRKQNQDEAKKKNKWVQYLNPLLLEKFNRLRKSSFKIFTNILRKLALSIFVAPESIYTALSVDPKDNILLVHKITTNWVSQFIDNHNIVLLSQHGRLTCNLEKELQIEQQTAYHLGVLQRGFATEEFDENLMENLNETHFVVNLDNGWTLGLGEIRP